MTTWRKKKEAPGLKKKQKQKKGVKRGKKKRLATFACATRENEKKGGNKVGGKKGESPDAKGK